MAMRQTESLQAEDELDDASKTESGARACLI